MEQSYSMPWGFSLFRSPPYEYIGNRILSVTFETEATVLRQLVPEPLIPNPDSLARIFVGSLRFDFGYSYLECGLLMPASFGGQQYDYVMCLYLDAGTNPVPVVGGREIWGAPKMEAQISFVEEPEQVRASVTRRGVLLAEVALSLGQRSDRLHEELVPWLFLKLIPSAREDHEPDVMQLVSLAIPKTVRDFSQGDATLSLNTTPGNPFSVLPIRRVIDSSFEVCDWTLGFGEILLDYLAEKERIR